MPHNESSARANNEASDRLRFEDVEPHNPELLLYTLKHLMIKLCVSRQKKRERKRFSLSGSLTWRRSQQQSNSRENNYFINSPIL